MKYEGENWFSHLTFPFSFSLLSNDMLWAMGTWIEVIGASALILGLATRFVSFSLIMLTIIAINTVHWPAEWNTLAEQGIKAVAGNPDAIGYVSIGAAEYVATHNIAIKLLSLEGVAASVANVLNHSFYPYPDH